MIESAPPCTIFIKGVMRDGAGHDLYNYEDWLRELLNHSSSFMRKTRGALFCSPNDESHGEADAISCNYNIDFKLVRKRKK